MVGPSSQISKILLSLLFLLIIYYIFMDIELYLRIQNYPIERKRDSQLKINDDINNDNIGVVAAAATAVVSTVINATDLMAVQSTLQTHSSTISARAPEIILKSYETDTWITCNINPLCHVTVKAVLLDHTNHYVFAPLAVIFDQVIGISRSDVITANMISVFHVGVAAVSGKLVASDSLGYRRLGVVLFQFRTFLDDLDGYVARQKKHIVGEYSEVGTSGYYIDGLCDAFGCIFLILGMFFYLKNNPPRRGYTQLPMHECKLPEPVTAAHNGSSSSSSLRPLPLTKLKHTTYKVFKKIINFSGQLLLSSTAWNRYIAVYQNMLERGEPDVTPVQQERQLIIFKSTWWFCIAWLWRVVNVHSLLHLVLLSIFCDKLWDFLKAIQYSGYIVLLIAICASEMYIIEAHNFIYKTWIIANNTSL